MKEIASLQGVNHVIASACGERSLDVTPQLKRNLHVASPYFNVCPYDKAHPHLDFNSGSQR